MTIDITIKVSPSFFDTDALMRSASSDYLKCFYNDSQYYQFDSELIPVSEQFPDVDILHECLTPSR